MNRSSILSLPLILCLFASAGLAQFARAAVPADPATTATHNSTCVASFGDLSVITYLELGTFEISAVTSDEFGTTWSAPAKVNAGPGIAPTTTGYQHGNESIAVSGDHVYVTWYQNPFVRFQRSTDRGQTFETFDRQLGAPVGDVEGWSFTVERDPGGDPNLDRIHVFMQSNDQLGSDDLYLATSFNGGESFGAPVGVSTLNGTGQIVKEFSLTTEGNYVFCTWTDKRSARLKQWVTTSSDGGLTFGPEVMLAPTNSLGGTTGPVNIAAGPSGLVAACVAENLDTTGTNREIYVGVSTDFGATWTPAVEVGEYDTLNDNAKNAEIAISDGNIIVIWEDDRAGGLLKTYSSVSSDQGVTWAPDIQLSQGQGVNARFSKDSRDALVVVWDSRSTPRDAEAAYSLDDGKSFVLLAETLNQTPDNLNDLAVAINPTNGNVIACWSADDASDSFGFRAYAGGFSLCAPGAVSTRSEAENQDVYTVTTSPLLGAAVTATIDASQTGHALTALVGFLGSSSLALPSGPVLLVDLTDPAGEVSTLAPLPGPQATYAIAVPTNPELCGLTIYTQGALIGGGQSFALTNAQDLLLGSY